MSMHQSQIGGESLKSYLKLHIIMSSTKMQLGLLKLGPHMQIRKKLIICKSKVAQKRDEIPTTEPQLHLGAELVVESEVEAEAEEEV